MTERAENWGLTDIARDARSDPQRHGIALRELAEQLNSIAQKLVSIEGRPAPLQGPHRSGEPTHKSQETSEVMRGQAHGLAGRGKMARAIYSIRRRREFIFGDADLFGEPAWDILLDLYAAHASGKTVSVSSACIGSAAPPTTGLRWLGILADQNLVVREHDPNDQRRVNVRLSDKAIAKMDTYFAEASAAV